MFEKILIANRGEIACRVIKTARRMGIKTVAVYSEADAAALHVEMADEAVLIGPPPSAQSYLQAERIVEACRRTGAQAVHPGYGFLSEKSEFCRALEAEGISFIGPGVDAIAAMGDKIESKKLAHAAKVSTVPGFLGTIADEDEAVRIARDIGYPVMIKASAGGGGKGMRIARNDAEAREGFRSARSEARSSFADDRVFVEKYVTQPRHIEIQVLADSFGNTIYLGERECSIQRRHQKVIEEAPSPFLDEATRRAMGEQAVALAKAVNYRSAGTVEFIVDADRNFYFLEMNTRLQVEHPVTEMVTGLDLVEWMIRIAAGERLTVTQDDVKLCGWSIEARVYAEEPTRNFLPSTGRLVRYSPPAGADGVRVDTGVAEGGEISMFYDPMIAKLITYGADRAEATRRMSDALDRFEIKGVGHNIAFLTALMNHPRFVEGRLTTNFIAEEFPSGFSGIEPSERDAERLVAVAATLQRQLAERERTISGQSAGHPAPALDRWVARTGGRRYECRVEPGEAFTVEVGTLEAGKVEGESRELRVEGGWRPGQTLWTGSVDGDALSIQVERAGIGWRLVQGGAVLRVEVLTPRAADLAELMPVKQAPDMSKYLLSPMPGLLTRVSVEAGQDVKAGEELAVVEAMKMENILRAEADGKVAKIHAQAGASLAVDQIIIEFA
jgi:propionyl-CoA carboxylase alpha chain